MQNGQEAEFLVNQVMLYFVQPTERKATLLERFNKEPDMFQHMDLIQELENIQLGWLEIKWSHRMNIQLSNQIILIEATNFDLRPHKHQGQSYFEEMRNFILELKAQTQTIE